jgi:hypothetical protein
MKKKTKRRRKSQRGRKYVDYLHGFLCAAQTVLDIAEERGHGVL